jgi:hypothetical protein
MLARYRLNRAIIEEEFRKRRDLALLIQGWKFLHINTQQRASPFASFSCKGLLYECISTTRVYDNI